VKVADLIALGASVVGGQIDFGHVNVGRCMPNGEALLTPDGEQYVDKLRTIEMPAPVAAPVAVAAPAKKAKAKKEAPAAEGDLGDLLSDLE
jgi:hypothetical protein